MIYRSLSSTDAQVICVGVSMAASASHASQSYRAPMNERSWPSALGAAVGSILSDADPMAVHDAETVVRLCRHRSCVPATSSSGRSLCLFIGVDDCLLRDEESETVSEVESFDKRRPSIPYGKPEIDDSDRAAVLATLHSDLLTQGPALEAFEAGLCLTTGARYAVAFSSGTGALHAAVVAAGLGPGAKVAVPSLTFMASVNCVLYADATPIFVDIEPATLNMDLEAVPSDVDALVAVHFAGLPMQLANLPVRPRVIIEDAAHALGSEVGDQKVGSCATSDMCCFSFHPVKAITSGEGGAVTTNAAALAERLRRFRNHGIDRKGDDPAYRYTISEAGFNYRLSELHAALGASQLRRLEYFVGRRNSIADKYMVELVGLPLALPPVPPRGTRHSYHLFVVQVDRREHVFNALRAAGIGTQVHYVPLHTQPRLREWGTSTLLPHTARAGDRILSLPIFPSLTDDEQDYVVDVLRRTLS